MPLDKQALESLRLDADSEPQRYRDATGGRRRLWIVVAVMGVSLRSTESNRGRDVSARSISAFAPDADGTSTTLAF